MQTISLWVLERFWRKVAKTNDGCWIWTGAKSDTGYGTFNLGRGHTVLVHRLSYQLAKGNIPVGLELDHLCRNKACVNPEHLQPVTRSVNTLRGNGPLLTKLKFAAKTHCPNGHPYDEANTFINADGHRGCLICRREKTRRHRRKLAQVAAVR